MKTTIETFRDQTNHVANLMASLTSARGHETGNEVGRLMANISELEAMVLVRRNPEAEARRANVIARARALVQARTSKAPANDRY